MATLRAAVLATLQADVPLNAILTGGVTDWDALGREGLTMSTAQLEADGVSIKPQAVLTWSTETPELEGYGTRGRRRFLSVWAYSHDSYATIEAALRACEDALHRALISTDDAGQVLLVPLTTVIAVRLAPAHLRGRYFALSNVVWGFAWAVAALFGGVMLDTTRPALLWPIIIMVVLTGGLVGAHVARAPRLQATTGT